MNDNIKRSVEKFTAIAIEAEAALNEWTGEKCLQFPALLTTMAVKLNWDEQEIRRNDPLVRFYIREHSDWHVTRGAHGGIMRMSDKLKKEQSKSAKDAAKEAARAVLAAKESTVTTEE